MSRRPSAPQGRRRRDATTSTGTHRAVGAGARRSVAVWPIACLVLIGLMVAGWFGWNWANGLVESRAAERASGCSEGQAVLHVAVEPGLAEPVSSAAEQWNRDRTVVRNHCVRVQVRSAPTEEVFTLLTEGDRADTHASMPSAWLPGSQVWVDRLSAARPGLIGSRIPVESGANGPQPYLTLAGETLERVQQHAAQSFGAFLSGPGRPTAWPQP